MFLGGLDRFKAMLNSGPLFAVQLTSPRLPAGTGVPLSVLSGTADAATPADHEWENRFIEIKAIGLRPLLSRVLQTSPPDEREPGTFPVLPDR